jgi:hypothetical protein
LLAPDDYYDFRRALARSGLELCGMGCFHGLALALERIIMGHVKEIRVPTLNETDPTPYPLLSPFPPCSDRPTAAAPGMPASAVEHD